MTNAPRRSPSGDFLPGAIMYFETLAAFQAANIPANLNCVFLSSLVAGEVDSYAGTFVRFPGLTADGWDVLTAHGTTWLRRGQTNGQGRISLTTTVATTIAVANGQMVAAANASSLDFNPFLTLGRATADNRFQCNIRKRRLGVLVTLFAWGSVAGAGTQRLSVGYLYNGFQGPFVQCFAVGGRWSASFTAFSSLRPNDEFRIGVGNFTDTSAITLDSVNGVRPYMVMSNPLLVNLS